MELLDALYRRRLYCLREQGPLWDMVRRLDACRRGESSPAEIHALFRDCQTLYSLAETLGVEGNLWQATLTWEILRDENPFALTCEGRGDTGGTLSRLALHDMECFLTLFCYDFSDLPDGLGAEFADILRYHAGERRSPCAKTRAGALVSQMRDRLAASKNAGEARAAMTEFYRAHGTGDFGLYHAFRLDAGGGCPKIMPLTGVAAASLSDLVGCEEQKKRLTENTEAFLAGKPANHVLLYGDGGTGKSTCVRSLLREYADTPLRLIELGKPLLSELPRLIGEIKGRNYCFIVFIDDLSFEEHETGYKHLKAVIEGGLETMPENVRIYATSNRRHIVRETWNDKSDMEHTGDVHRSDTVEEKLSLVSRFGVAINFSAPNRKQYHAIVRALAAKQLPFPVDDGALITGANAWEIRRGGVSGRTAQQYIDHLAGKKE